MAQIPPITDAYIDDIIKSYGPYIDTINKTQGIKFRELIKRLRDYFEQEIPKNTSQLVNDSNYVTSSLISGLPEENGSKRPFIIRPLANYNPDEVFGTGNQPLHVMLVATELIVGKETVTQLKISDGVTSFKDLKNLIGSGGSGENGLQPSISLTYTQLRNLKDNSLLIPGQKYIINDFQSRFNECELLYDNVTKINSLNFTGNVYSGDVEPLIVTAATNNALEPVAYSTLYPYHEIIYTTDNLLQEVLASNKGTILFRKDLQRNSLFSIDCVALRYKHNGIIKQAINLSSNSNIEIIAKDYYYGTSFMIISNQIARNSTVKVGHHFVIGQLWDSEIIGCEICQPTLYISGSKLRYIYGFNKCDYPDSNYLRSLTIDGSQSDDILTVIDKYFMGNWNQPPFQWNNNNIPLHFSLIAVRSEDTGETRDFAWSVDLNTNTPIAIPLFERP
ncbi:hypothetical protein [Pedobacter sp.]|uniref:hypothetical protein n=1 Tax=Pedobacter sp. TaxID=1411316 RepID=UPI00396CE241